MRNASLKALFVPPLFVGDDAEDALVSGPVFAFFAAGDGTTAPVKLPFQVSSGNSTPAASKSSMRESYEVSRPFTVTVTRESTSKGYG